MKKHGFKTLVVLSLIVLGYFTYTNNAKSSGFDEIITKLEESSQKKVDSLYVIIDTQRVKDRKDSITIVNLLEQAEVSDKQAEAWEYSYQKLLKQKPQTIKDSLKNYVNRDVVNRKTIISLKSSNKKKDTAIALQVKRLESKDLIISKLEGIVAEKDTLHIESIKLYDKELKVQRNKGRKEGAIGVFGVIGIMALFII